MDLAKVFSVSRMLLRILIAGVCAPFLFKAVAVFMPPAFNSHEHAQSAFANPGVTGFMVIGLQLGASVLAILGCGFRAALGAALLAFIAFAAPWLEPTGSLPANAGFASATERISIGFALLMGAWGHARVAVSRARWHPSAYQGMRQEAANQSRQKRRAV